MSADTGSVMGIDAARDVLGQVVAGQDVYVRAGRRIDATVRASRNVGDVSAWEGIAGEVTASGDIGSVLAGDALAWPSPRAGLDAALWSSINPDQDVYVPLSSLPGARPGRPAVGVGDITAAVTADGGLGTVRAGGAITGGIWAGGAIGAGGGPGVLALGDISGSIHAGSGTLEVAGWGKVSGGASAPVGLSVWAYGDVSGGLSADIVQVGSWEDVSAGVQALWGSDVRAWGDVGGTYVSGSGPITAWAGGSFGAVLTSGGYVAVSAQQGVGGGARSESSDVWLFARYGSIGGEYESGDLVQLTAGQDITTSYLRGKGNMVLDAGRAISGVQSATSGKNLWAAARGGSLSATLRAEGGWAYAWGYHDVSGYVQAKDTASVTAWRDLTASVTSVEDGVQAWVGRNVIDATITGKAWLDLEARGNVSGAIRVGDEEEPGEAFVRAGGGLAANVTSTGSADVAAVGHINGDVAAGDGWLEVVSNASITGKVTAGADGYVQAGEHIFGEVKAQGTIDVVAGQDVASDVTSAEGHVGVRAGGSVTGKVTAKLDAMVEAASRVSGTVSGENVAVLANGDISGEITAGWVADVRSANGQITGTIKTPPGRQPSDWLSSSESPAKQRLDRIDTDVTRLNAERATLLANDPGADTATLDGRLQSLAGEREVLAFQDKDTDFQKIPAERVRGLLSDGLAKEYDGPSYRWYATTGYVALADVVGDETYFYLLEPFADEEYEDSRGETYTLPTSLVGKTTPSRSAEYYKVVKRFVDVYEGTPAEAISGLMADDKIKLNIEGVIGNKIAGTFASVKAVVTFGVTLVPLVGAVNDYLDGKYADAAVSLMGDVGMFFGFGAALKARKCLRAGREAVKIAAGISAAGQAGATAFQLGRGIDAYLSDDTAKAYGLFGDATLRLLGLSVQAIAWLKNKPKCFVAGTPVQTEGRAKPIEQVRPGDRVWAYDRQAQEWRLASVTRAFRNQAEGPLATVRLSNGDELTGTDGHPFWVVEGEELHERGRPDHGGDEPAGPTPGRWVPLAHLRVGDRVLARAGRVSRVLAVEVGRPPEPVYNLEVEGLHSYAVGAGGALVHNGDPCTVGGAALQKRGKATGAPESAVQQPAGQGASPSTSVSGGANGNAIEVPDAGSVIAQTTTGKKSKYHRDRGQVSKLPASHKFQVESRSAKPDRLTGDDLKEVYNGKTLGQWIEERNALGTSGGNMAAKTPASEAVGTYGADQYMKSRVFQDKNAKPRFKGKENGGNGNNEFDAIWFHEPTNTYYVVEAKGYEGRMRPKTISGTVDNPTRAQQGSKPYFEKTLEQMRDAGGVNGEVANTVLRAYRDPTSSTKVIYLGITTKGGAGKNPQFSVAKFKL